MGPRLLSAIVVVSLAFAQGASANLVIDPTFDASITGNANAAAIEGAINSAIATIEGLYVNPVTIPVTFTYDPDSSGNLLSTNQTEYYEVSYLDYVALLAGDSAANPGNSVLATAIANLKYGNDSNGSEDMALTGGLYTMLTGQNHPGASININSTQNFSFTDPTPSGQYDLIGGLEHELDEVLGGGGGGSTLNQYYAESCPGTGDFCNLVGPTDLYRYSAPYTPSFTTSQAATAYLSVDGGLTPTVDFNQSPSGDYGDFAPSCGTGTGADQLIQNAFNCTGQDEAYTTSSPEYEMLESIGWDGTAPSVPEPGTLILCGAGLAMVGASRYLRAARRAP